MVLNLLYIMDNKTRAYDQFCSHENVEYLSQQIGWTHSEEELLEIVRAFLSNNKAFISNSEDMWKSVRFLNRRFIETVNPNPNTDTSYTNPAEWFLWNQEIYS